MSAGISESLTINQRSNHFDILADNILFNSGTTFCDTQRLDKCYPDNIKLIKTPE